MFNKNQINFSSLIQKTISKLGNYKENFAVTKKTISLFLAIVLLFVISSFLMERKCITVNDGHTVQNYYSSAISAESILKSANLSRSTYKLMSMERLGRNINISLRYVFPVYVTLGNTTYTVSFISGGTVADAISEAGIHIDEHDSVNLPLDKVLTETDYIDIVDVSYITETFSENIPFGKKTVYSDKTSVSGITTVGKNGTLSYKKITKLVNGVANSTEVTEKQVVSEAVDQVLTIGTKPVKTISNLKKQIPLDAQGEPLYYKKHITVQATAYSGGGNTASGKKLEPGCVAVNTNIFPYGTKFYIKSSDGKYIYGYAEARDTGGFVATRPTNFDLYFATETEAINFGRRNIEVWVVE